MKKIGVFYGTTSGTTAGVVDELEFYLRKDDYEVHNVADGISSLSEYENLILVTPTYGVGELQADWENVYDEFCKIDFTGKVVGLIGLGNQYAFGESFVGGIRKSKELFRRRYNKSCRVDIRNEGKSCSYRNRKIWTYW